MMKNKHLDTSLAQKNPQDYQRNIGFGFNLPIFTFDAYLLLEAIKKASETGEELNVLFIASGSCALAVQAGLIAAEHPNIKLTFNDINKESLIALQKQLPNSAENITYLPGDIFKVSLGENKFNKVACHNLLHFFSGDEIDALLSKIHACLKPSGSLHLVTASPHQNLLKKLNLVKKWDETRGERWPNFFPDYKAKIKDHVPPDLVANLPQQLHFISRKQLI